MKLWDPLTGQCLHTFVSFLFPFPPLALSLALFNHYHLFFFSFSFSYQTGHDNWVRDAVFHPSGKFLVSVSDDKSMKVWELKTGKCMKTYEAHSHFVTSVAFNKKSPVVATGSVDQVLKVWDCR